MSAAYMSLSARAGSWTVLGLLAGLYAAQSVTGSMVQTALPVVLRDAGMSLDWIGYLAVLFLPWGLKFIWAPMVDRLLSEQAWILICQAGIATCFLTATALPPHTHMMQLAAVLLVMGFFAATQDIATDSLAVQASDESSRGKASGASTAGAYLGFLIGGGLWLIVYSYAGWAVSMIAMAGFVLLLSIPVLLSGSMVSARRNQNASTSRASLRATLTNRTLVAGLVFLFVYQFGLRMGSAMTGPYLVDKGVALDVIATVRGAGGAIAGFIAAILGAAVVQRFGIVRSVVIVAVLNVAILLVLAWADFISGLSPSTIVMLLLVQSAVVAMSFVAIYAAMMNWCNRDQAATDFAVLQSVDAVIAIAASAVAGLFAQSFGYGLLFLFSGLAIAVAILLAPRFLAASRRISVLQFTPEVSEP